MFRFYLRQLFKAFLPRSRRRRRPIARKRTHNYRPQLEGLEDRLVPATVTYTQSTGLLQFAGLTTADNVSVMAPAANQVVIQVGNADSVTLAGDAATSADFSLSTTTTA